MSTDEQDEAVREADNAFVERAPNTVFPWEMQMPRGGTMRLCGLTKREYFAGLAMQALIAADGDEPYFEDLHPIAIKHADALLAALEASK